MIFRFCSKQSHDKQDQFSSQFFHFPVNIIHHNKHLRLLFPAKLFVEHTPVYKSNGAVDRSEPVNGETRHSNIVSDVSNISTTKSKSLQNTISFSKSLNTSWMYHLLLFWDEFQPIYNPLCKHHISSLMLNSSLVLSQNL